MYEMKETSDLTFCCNVWYSLLSCILFRNLTCISNDNTLCYYSAIYKHSSDADHKINYDNPKVLASDNIKIRLQVKETLLIKDLAAYKSLNVNIDSFECKLW